MGRALSVASDDVMAHAAAQVLHAEVGETPGTAVDAVVAGLLALATLRADVFLGSCSVLVGGIGHGLVAIDGRSRQPGLGAPRPRGYQEGEAIPEGVRVAVPGLPFALPIAHSGRGNKEFSSLATTAVASARSFAEVPSERAALLVAYGREQTALFAASSVSRIRERMLLATPRSKGGLLTAEDFAVSPSFDKPARVDAYVLCPWFVDYVPSARACSTVAAFDAFGAFAIGCASYGAPTLKLPDTGLEMPLIAEPVRRGVPRLAPGTQLPSLAPIAFETSGASASVLRALGHAEECSCDAFVTLCREQRWTRRTIGLEQDQRGNGLALRRPA